MTIKYPLISVIMPAFNVEPWIEASIDSVIKQSYPNIELIIIDDCSTDNTYSIIENISKEHNIIKYKRNIQNLKICKTLNHGIQMSSGEYIARIDADDIAYIERIQKQFDFLVENNLDLVGCQMTAIDEYNNILSSSKLPCGLELINSTKLFRAPITHIWLCKKEIYQKLNYYRDIPYAEDYDFLLRALDHGYKCDNHPEELMFIRHRIGNTASTVSLKQRKTHSYVVKLAKERQKNNSLKDSFSITRLNKHIYYWNITNTLHNYSSKQLNNAYKTTNTFKKIMYLILCSLTSIYNLSYLVDKVKYIMNYKRMNLKKS
ncbi:hypothetical protein AHYW_004191 [Providencia manganoxydans]|uniref:glycosyltransferase family 2 protein n=1 Tax=Providencia TaxID=586 RepID=UPI0011200601|nr:glycosyltransferase family 2 protein [Providencia stuartii]